MANSRRAFPKNLQYIANITMALNNFKLRKYSFPAYN